METEVITERDGLVIRRARLEPGQTTPWHIDTCHRFTVVVSGSRLAIEFKDNGDVEEFDVHPGMADWDVPEARIHRAINKGHERFEEVVTFFRGDAAVDPQPTKE
jgi:oxalate decarboxylase/phosphoglucose isomerase-like protein (cupin superfamily)